MQLPGYHKSNLNGIYHGRVYNIHVAACAEEICFSSSNTSGFSSFVIDILTFEVVEGVRYYLQNQGAMIDSEDT